MDWSIHHVNIQSHDVRKTVKFFEEIIGIPEGKWTLPTNNSRGDFDAGPEYLALMGENSRGIHIVKPVPEFARKNGLSLNPTIGGHFAITVQDLDAVKSRLDAANIMYSIGGEYAMAGVKNLYLYDPSMNIIEINQLID